MQICKVQITKPTIGLASILILNEGMSRAGLVFLALQICTSVQAPLVHIYITEYEQYSTHRDSRCPDMMSVPLPLATGWHIARLWPNGGQRPRKKIEKSTMGVHSHKNISRPRVGMRGGGRAQFVPLSPLFSPRHSAVA